MSDKSLDRRNFLKSGLLAGLGVAALNLSRPKFALATAEFTLPELPYKFDALEPYIDTETMMIHHGKHHAAYVMNLNDKLKDRPDLLKLTIEELLANTAEKIPHAIRKAVIDNGGGHYNHTMFWTVLGPNGGGEPKGAVAGAIKEKFGDFQNFKDEMKNAGLTQVGSGWAWLVKNSDGKLEVYSTANQESPIMTGKLPLLGIDVWEHAYYLKYKNKRDAYIDAIWNVVNWDAVDKRFASTEPSDPSNAWALP